MNMSNKNSKAVPDQSRRDSQKPGRNVVSVPPNGSVGIFEPDEGSFDASYSLSQNAKVALLSKNFLQTAQQQSLTQRFNQTQGNHYLQRLVGSTIQKKKKMTDLDHNLQLSPDKQRKETGKSNGNESNI